MFPIIYPYEYCTITTTRILKGNNSFVFLYNSQSYGQALIACICNPSISLDYSYILMTFNALSPVRDLMAGGQMYRVGLNYAPIGQCIRL